MKIPSTWQRVHNAKCEPERLEFEVPCSKRMQRLLELCHQESEKRIKECFPHVELIADKPGAICRRTIKGRRFKRCNGVWTETRTTRNPDYVTPPFFQTVYGIEKLQRGGCFLCKFPPKLRSRDMMLAIARVARGYGHPDRGENGFLLEGCDQGIWDDAHPEVPRYEWDGLKLARVEWPSRPPQPERLFIPREKFARRYGIYGASMLPLGSVYGGKLPAGIRIACLIDGDLKEARCGEKTHREIIAREAVPGSVVENGYSVDPNQS